jgi:HAD superfamily hydrolase (TIGR01509 family)
MNIDAVLFDADGVIQRPSAKTRDAWLELLGPGRDVDAFVAALFQAERPALEGQADFVEALTGLLVEWECRGSLNDALAAWTMIEVDPDVPRIVRTLRRSGVGCYLATNQESHRALCMSGKLGYRDLFDREFYSCRMGVMKPSIAYFEKILKELDLTPARVLLLDDHAPNVDSAREVGFHGAEISLEGDAGQLVRTLGLFGIHVV